MQSQPANPFRPGAGHRPPYLAGRENEIKQFRRLLDQSVILENMVLTGLRGVGKTVLLDELKPIAHHESWIWVGTDLSESMSLTEDRIAERIMVDLAPITSSVTFRSQTNYTFGFQDRPDKHEWKLTYEVMSLIYGETPGVSSDKLKRLLEFVWEQMKSDKRKGIVFVYDEAQNMSDHVADKQYPLSLMLDVFQSLQRKNIPIMLVLAGLPTLFPKLVEARTYSERMFRVLTVDRLTASESRDAITKPEMAITFDETIVQVIVEESGGYPYFIQFFCRELFDLILQCAGSNREIRESMADVLRKLDNDFFDGRWAKVTNRQRELLKVIAQLPTCESEFSVQEIVELSKSRLQKPFSSSHVNQLLLKMGEIGMIYKNRYGKYSFAVPLLNRYIRRQLA
jgi:AAA+ ATPase superfamily predicted ATPase